MVDEIYISKFERFIQIGSDRFLTVEIIGRVELRELSLVSDY
jgi:hypothetical protein